MAATTPSCILVAVRPELPCNVQVNVGPDYGVLDPCRASVDPLIHSVFLETDPHLNLALFRHWRNLVWVAFTGRGSYLRYHRQRM